jgi:hypothetical protein
MIVSAVLAAQMAGTLVLTDTSRTDARYTYPLTVVQTPRHEEVVIAWDVATVPLARMVLRSRTFTLTAMYSPTITAADLELQDPVQVFHVGVVSASWFGRQISVTASEAGSYGQYNAALLYAGQASAGVPVGGLPTGGTTGTGQTPPLGGATTATGSIAPTTPVTITSAASTSSALVRWQLDRRTMLTVSGGYAVGGGLGADSIAYLPEEYGPFAAATVRYQLTGHESVSTILTGQQFSTYGACPAAFTGPTPTSLASIPLCREDATATVLEELYQRGLSATERFSVGIGIAAATQQASGPEPVAIPDELVLLPFAEGNFRYGMGPTSTLSLSAQLQPLIDPRTGLPSERAQELVSLSNLVTSTLTIIGTFGAMQSIPIPGADAYALSSFNAGVEARRRLSPQFTALAGVTGYWQTQAGFPSVGSLTAYAGFSAALPAMRF